MTATARTEGTPGRADGAEAGPSAAPPRRSRAGSDGPPRGCPAVAGHGAGRRLDARRREGRDRRRRHRDALAGRAATCRWARSPAGLEPVVVSRSAVTDRYLTALDVTGARRPAWCSVGRSRQASSCRGRPSARPDRRSAAAVTVAVDPLHAPARSAAGRPGRRLVDPATLRDAALAEPALVLARGVRRRHDRRTAWASAARSGIVLDVPEDRRRRGRGGHEVRGDRPGRRAGRQPAGAS